MSERDAAIEAPAQATPALSHGAVRGQGVLIGFALLGLLAISWHLTRHQVEEVCRTVQGHHVCVQRIQTWWNPFGPREDDVRVSIDVDQCGTLYPSPLPVTQPLRPEFRDDSVVLQAEDGSRFVYSALGAC